MKGRKPKPTRQKIIEGNPGGRPLNDNEPEPTIGVPDMPDWLEPIPEAVENWEYESNQLNKMGVMTEADRGILASRCAAYADIVQLSDEIISLQADLDSVEDVKEKVAVYKGIDSKRKRRHDAITRFVASGSLLGLDPSSRSRIKVAPKERKNPFGELGKPKLVK